MQAVRHPAEESDLAVARLDAACALVREGSIGEADAILSALAEPSVDALLHRPERALVRAATLDCRLARGDLAGAVMTGHALDEFLTSSELAAAIAHHARGELASAMGDAELALGHYLAVDVETSEDPVPLELLPWRAGAALALVRLRRRPEATEMARAHHEAAIATGSAYSIALALRTLAATDAGDQRIALLRQALAVLGGSRHERLLAQVGTDLAGLLALLPGGSGQAEAIDLLRSAETYAGRQELWPLQGRVRRLLAHLGEEARPVDSVAIASLTASERRVAALAAGGLTNRQIAEQLMVSVKAVEWHLSNVYRKLEVRSRKSLQGV